MNELIIPPAPSWYKSSIVACSPDNTFVYGSKADIVILKYKDPESPAEVKFIPGAHSRNVVSLSMNKKWNQPYQHLVSLGDDNLIKVWDLETCEQKFINKEHVEYKDAAVGAIFAGDDRVVSVSLNGAVVIWNINTNEVKTLKKLFDSKVTVTCLSSCPHASYLIAFGLFSGCVVVADLRRNGRILYKLRGHQNPVVSLAWCPAPVNVFPRYNWNTVGNKALENETKEIKKENPWVNLVHVDDNEKRQENPPEVEAPSDFLHECMSLKDKILGIDKTDDDTKDLSLSSGASVEECKTVDPPPIEKPRDFEEVYETRPLPMLYDPSCDFADDLANCEVIDPSITTKINEDSGIIPDLDQNICHVEDSSSKSNVISRAQEAIVEEPRHEYLLASSARDRNIYIWRGGTDGRMQTFFEIPSKKGKTRSKSGDNWITMCWITPTKLLTSSATGQLLQWTLPLPKKAYCLVQERIGLPKVAREICHNGPLFKFSLIERFQEFKGNSKQYKMIHNEHQLLFNIAAPPVYSTENDWQNQTYTSVWTTDQHGIVLNFDLKAHKINYSCSTINSLVSCFDTAPLDPNRLAMGFRDGKVKVWDLSLPHVNKIAMAKYHKNISNSKIVTISWHPVKEMMLGFATDEGRVGFIDMAQNKVILLSHYFNSSVYRVEWGPMEGNKNSLALYAVSDGKIIYYDIKDVNDAPSLLDVPDNFYCYKFSWKPDFSFLLISGKDGSLLFLSPDLKVITIVYLCDKGLLSLSWHPEANSSDCNSAPRCNWFAATASKGIVIYNCDIESDATDKIIATLEGHLKPPVSLAWSPFDPYKLVSASPDGLCHVWNVKDKTVVATYVDIFRHINPQVIWSPIDPDLIILGEHIICVWRVSEHPPKIDEEFLDERRKLMKSSPDGEKSSKDKKDSAKVKKVPKNCILPTLYASSDENFAIQVSNMRKLMNNKEKTDDPLGIFGDKEQILQLLMKTFDSNKKQGKYKYCDLIALWRGDIADQVKEAINENRVTPTIISIAPMVSPKLWQEACEVYAKKLLEDTESDPLEIAMYFLACHKVEDAISSLCINQLYREALALAKCRLPEDSDIITDVLEKWALHCVHTGNFEIAAQCYISANKYEEAAKVLARRNNAEFLEFAIELAAKAENKELVEALTFKLAEIGKNKEKPDQEDVVLKATFEAELDFEEKDEDTADKEGDDEKTDLPEKDLKQDTESHEVD